MSIEVQGGLLGVVIGDTFEGPSRVRRTLSKKRPEERKVENHAYIAALGNRLLELATFLYP